MTPRYLCKFKTYLPYFVIKIRFFLPTEGLGTCAIESPVRSGKKRWKQEKEKSVNYSRPEAVNYFDMAATSVVVLDRGNNTTCTINLHGKHCFSHICCFVASAFQNADSQGPYMFFEHSIKNWHLLNLQLFCLCTFKALQCTVKPFPLFVEGATVVSWRVNNQEQLFVR